MGLTEKYEERYEYLHSLPYLTEAEEEEYEELRKYFDL